MKSSRFPRITLAVVLSSGAALVAAEAQAQETCVNIKRGELGNVTDTFLSGDNAAYAPGGESNIFFGQSSGK